jgi:D-tyrosyl-tRNA(Tyr) deacylase
VKIVLQRVKEASCTVDGKLVSSIDQGYLLLVGLTHTDTIETVKFMAKKIANLRIFEDESGKLNKSILDMGYEILSISQFTLYGDARKGNRPSFTEAMAPKEAEKLYLALSQELISGYSINTKNGKFGEMMDIGLLNDGPVTIILEK